MIDELNEAIARTEDEAAKPRLARCIPRLIEVVGNWNGTDAASPGLVLAVATPDSAMVLHADNGWPLLDAAVTAQIGKGEAALAVVCSIDSGKFEGEVVINGIALLLGHAGLLAQSQDALEIMRTGKSPMAVALLECSGQTVTVLTTTVAAPLVTVH